MCMELRIKSRAFIRWHHVGDVVLVEQNEFHQGRRVVNFFDDGNLPP